MAQSSSSCSQRSSSVTTCTSCTKKKREGRCVERLDWHIDTRKKLKAGCSLLAQGSKDASLTCCRCPAPTLSHCQLALRTRTLLPNPSCTPNLGPDQHLPLWFTRKAYAKKDLGKNRQEALSDLPSSSDNSKTSDGNPWQSWYGWTLLFIAQQLNAITTRSDHGLMRKWRQKFIRTGMRIHVCKNIEGLRQDPPPPLLRLF